MIGSAFRDSVLDAQATFRAVLDAVARPGTVTRLTQPASAPKPLSPGAAAIALTLCDQDTPVWLDPDLQASPAVAEWLRFHTGARVTNTPSAAAFAFVSAPLDVPPFDDFCQGSLEYPDRSTTIIFQVESFRHGPALTLSGPGIRDVQRAQIAPLPPDMLVRLAANRRLFPCGVDLLFATDTDIMALPRAVEVASGDV